MDKVKLAVIEFKARWKAESPLFFRRIRNIALSIGIPAFAAISVSSFFPATIQLDGTLMNALGYLTVACAAIAGTSNLTRDDHDHR